MSRRVLNFLEKKSYVYILDIILGDSVMFQQLINNLQLNASNDDYDSRRTHERREMDSCVAIIDGKAYPVKNWSKGGILVNADDRNFALNDVKDVTMKFKLADRVMDVRHNGRILRKDKDQFVIQFNPLTQDVDKSFTMVVDDYVSQEFANSQQ
jgi:hypothetical protein